MSIALGIFEPVASFAGTLTSATFTTAGNGYTLTGATNTRYDWGFTTATSSTLTRVSAFVPAGTNTSNARYLVLNGAAGNYASTPSSSPTNTSTDLDIKVKVNLNSWTPATDQTLVSKWADAGSQHRFLFKLQSDGTLKLFYSTNGSDYPAVTTAPVGFAANSTQWVRVALQLNNGGSTTATFYSSTDGTTWTSFYSYTAGGTPSLYANTSPIEVGTSDAGTVNPAQAKIYFASVASGINGTTTSASTCSSSGVVACFNPADDSIGGTTWTSSSSQAESWTVNRSGTNLPADIASDLTVNSVTGLPNGGTASYRTIDRAAIYLFPSATAVGSGVNCTLTLTGFTNTTTAGSYTSTITTYDNSATPVSVDFGGTSSFIIAGAVNQSNTYVVIDPTFAFVLANQATACNGESNFVSGAGSANAISLGHLIAGANTSGGQSLSVVSNDGGGFIIYVRGTQGTTNLRSPGHNFIDVGGTYASPASLGAGEAFGYTYKDSTSSSSVTNPASAKFAALDNTNRAVMGSVSSASGSGCVSFDAQTSATTPAGSYSGTVFYTAVPTF